MIYEHEIEAELLKLPKEFLVKLYIQTNRGFYGKNLSMLRREILSLKIDINLENQRKVIDELDDFELYTGTNVVEFLKNHSQYEEINTRLKKLEKEYDKLQKERSEIE